MKTLLITFFILAGQLSFGQEKQFAKEPASLRFVNLFDAQSKEGVACYRIPSIVTAPNGDIIAAIDERVPSCGDLKWSKDINIVIRRSADNGENWSEIETVVDYPFGQSASDPSMIVDQQTKTIFLFFNYMDLENEKDIYYLRMIKSTDNGKSWSDPVDLTSQITLPEWKQDFMFITSGRGIQTSEGTLLHTLVNLNRGLYVFGSDNHGASWYLINTPIKPADESKIVELEDGSWLINSRVNKLGFRYIHKSEDRGQSWESRPDSSLTDPGCNASIINYRIKDKRNILLFSNAKTENERRNLTISISNDEGDSWSAGKIIYPGSAAYSSMTVLKNGDIGLFFEKDEYSKNVFVRIPASWLIDK